ncbi:coiled-coil domain-containing protein [uncultured Methylobacterium sp.]|uniref:coiled-coil domain-containing protein n=1 Tax=uncultured Methylobacterium sp. TaxID=157278 RepID=UPI0035CA867B
MNAVAFDTLKFARSLREKANLTPEQAEGMADAMAEVFAGSIPTKGDIDDVRRDIEAMRLATKTDIESLKVSITDDIETLRLSTKADSDAVRVSAKADSDALRMSTRTDIDALRLSTKADIDVLRLSTKADIETMKSEIIKWMFGTIGFQTVVILGAVVALSRSFR